MAVVSWLSNDNEVTKNKIRDDNIATIELNASSASKTYTVGKPFVLDSDGKLYKATQQIDQGSAIITSGANDNCEEVTEKILDTLGTASTKNSTSVVTDSSDLVESGAVKDIVGWGNANIADNHIDTSTALAGVTIALNPDKTITLSGTSISPGSRNCCVFLGSYLKSKGNTLYVSGGVANKAYIALRNDNYSYAKVSRGNTVAIDTSELLDDATYYITLGIEASGIDETGVVIKPMLSKNGGEYEPYHESVADTLRDAEVVFGKNKSTQDKINDVRWALHRNVESINTLYNDLKSANSAVIFSCDMKITSIVETADSYIYGVKLAKNGSITADYTLSISSITIGQTVHYQITIPLDALNNSDDIYLYSFGTGNTGLKAPSSWEKLFICDATESDLTYEPYYTPLKDVVPNKADNSVIGTVEGENASKAWSVGEHFIKDGAFKEVTQPIASGGTINDSNTVDKPIADCLLKKKTVTGTVSSSGNLLIDSNIIKVSCAYCTNANIICLPFVSSDMTYVHLRNRTVGVWDAVTEGNYTVDVYYFD